MPCTKSRAVGAVPRDIDGVAGAFQSSGQKIGNAFFVFDNQNSHRRLFLILIQSPLTRCSLSGA